MNLDEDNGIGAKSPRGREPEKQIEELLKKKKKKIKPELLNSRPSRFPF